jgi:hypothetical protein
MARRRVREGYWVAGYWVLARDEKSIVILSHAASID